MALRSHSLVACLGASLLTVAGVWAQTPAPERPRSLPGTDDPSEINRPFERPDAAEWTRKFESESREVYTRREAIVKALGLKPGQSIADIGAGTGLFTRMFADRVGPEGTVYAVDVSPVFLKHIADKARKQGQSQIHPVRGTQDSTNLSPGSIDAAFLCDTYHHFERPERVLATIHKALRPGGRLFVIDFDRRERLSSNFVLKHIRADKAQFLAEIAASGFERVATPRPPNLSENFFAEFRKLERPASPP